MVNAQQWLDKEYPKNKRISIKDLNIKGKKLEGSLKLEGFTNLERFWCDDNQLTELDISNLNPKKLKTLVISNNNFSKQTLDFLIPFVSIEILYIGNKKEKKIKQGIYNRFYGSLQPLKSMSKLRRLEIPNTDIDSGWENLPISLRYFDCLADCLSEAGVKKIAKIFEPYNFDIQKWKISDDSWLQKNEIGKIHNENWELMSQTTEQTLVNEFQEKSIIEEQENLKERIDAWRKKQKEEENFSKEKANNTLCDEYGNIPLHYFAYERNLEAAESFLQVNEEKIDAKGNEDLTPLHIAVTCNHKEMVDKFLRIYNADPNVRDRDGNTSLHFAAEQNNLELLQLLVDYDGNINATNEFGWSVLHSAASGIINEKEDWTIIKWLLEKGVDTSAKAKNDFSISDVFSQKDWSYAAYYDKLVEEFNQGTRLTQIQLVKK